MKRRRVVEEAVELRRGGEALARVGQVGPLAAVAEEDLVLPDVIAGIGAAGDLLVVLVAGGAPSRGPGSAPEVAGRTCWVWQ